MIHIKGKQQTGKEASECARNNNCSSAHVVLPFLHFICKLFRAGTWPSSLPSSSSSHLPFVPRILIGCTCMCTFKYKSWYIPETTLPLIYSLYCHPKSSKPCIRSLPSFPSMEIGRLYQRRKEYIMEKRGNCFGFCFFSFPGSPPT